MRKKSLAREWMGACLLAAAASRSLCAVEAGKEGADPAAAAKGFWPAWRGPLGTGVAPGSDPPLEWGEGKGIRWKIEVPGVGHSTPIVWGDRAFLTAAVPVGEALAKPIESRAPGAHDNAPITHRQRFVAMAIDRGTGKILWQRTLNEALPFEGAHRTASFASGSPVTDGERLFAHFGSHGLYAIDLRGELLWKADLGPMQILHGHGEGSSPILHGDLIFVNWDHEGQSFVAALDKLSGKERWRVLRDEITSWASPIVVQQEGKAQLIVSGTHRVRGYDAATGSVIWECGGLSSNVVASPVAGDGMVFAGSSYDTQALIAIRLEGAQGDITGTDRVAWQRSRGTPYVPSPLLYGGALYFLHHYQGILSRVEAKTGRDCPGAIRLDGIRNVYASPVGGGGRVYVTDLDGLTLVIADGDSPRIVARNQLDDTFSASAAIAGQDLFLRGRRYLYCIAGVR